MRDGFNWRGVLFFLGVFLCIEGAFMALSSVVSLIYGERDIPYLLLSTGITFASALLLLLSCRKYSNSLGRREGIVLVTSVWVVYSFYGMLPFYLSGAIPSVTDSFFETISGLTTTGASILTDIEALPHGLLFWRSIIQWLGGMGFVVLSMAILPFVNSDFQLFSAEATGPVHDKIQPRIKDTARRLWALYLSMTLAEAVLLWVGGMSFFDAICHSFTTLSTGGYSTKQASVAHWSSPFIQYVIILFMILGGTNFTMLYFVVVKHKMKRLVKDEEFRIYMLIVLIVSLLVTAIVALNNGVESWAAFEQLFRNALFQVAAVMTTTGFATYDYVLWGPAVTIIFLILMIMGGSAGSTSGAIKLSRIITLVKNGYYEFKRRLHPRAVLPIRMNGVMISEKVLNGIFSFCAVYAGMIVLGTFALTLMDMSMAEAFSATITALGNVGPGLGRISPSGSFAELTVGAKWCISFLMLVGRLELFTVLLLLVPSFWRK